MKPKKSQIIEICKKLYIDFVDYSFLSLGNHNETYLIKSKQGKYVLRIENNSQHKTLKKEYRLLKKINGKFAPKVYLFDNSRRIISRDYMVQEFIQGKHPERKVTTDFVRKMAIWYKKLHSIRTKKEYSLEKEFKSYKRKYMKFRKVLQKNLLDDLDTFFKKCVPILDGNEIFSKIKYLSLNHGDPTRTNVFYVNKKIKLIDWEFSEYTLKEEDLVFFIYSYDLSERQKKVFFNTYGYSLTKKGNKKLRIIFLLHYLGVIVWRIERLGLIKKGQVDPRQSASNEKEMIKELTEELEKANEIIGELR